MHPSSGHTYIYVYIEGRRSRHQSSQNKTASPTHARVLVWRLTSMELHIWTRPDGSPSPSEEFDLTLKAMAASSLERLRERSILQLLKKNIQT